MSKRPYFRSGIDDLEQLFASAEGNPTLLKALQQELAHREKPRARALKAKVDGRLAKLTGSPQGASSPGRPWEAQIAGYPTVQGAPPPLASPPSTPERVIVECSQCKTPNFVSALEGVVQHLACSSCQTPFEAQFKYGVLRTTFHTIEQPQPSGSGMKWLFAALLAVIVIVLLLK